MSSTSCKVFRMQEIYYVFTILICCANAAGPVLYPDFNFTEAIVENPETGELVSTHGAFKWYLCSDLPNDPSIVANCTCPDLYNLYTPSSRFSMKLSWMDDNGKFTSFKQPVEILLVTTQEVQRESVPKETRIVMLNLYLQGESATVVITVGNWTQSIKFFKDNKEPSAIVSFYPPEEQSEGLALSAKIEFNEYVFPVKNNSIYCMADVEKFENATNYQELVSVSEECFKPISMSGLEDLVTAKHMEDIQKLELKALNNNIIYISSIYKNLSVPADISLSIKANAISDYAGNTNSNNILGMLYHRPVVGQKTKDLSDRLITRVFELKPTPWNIDAAVVGTVASAAVGVAVGVSFAGSAASGGNPSSVTLLNNVQKLHMTGMLAVTKMPENYKNFTDSMGWAVLDFGSKDSNSTKSKSDKAMKIHKQENATDHMSIRNLKQLSLEAQDDEDELNYFKRIFFWVPVLFALLLTLHFSALYYFFKKERPLYAILQFPRLELMFAFFAMPALSIASAGLYLGNRIQAMIATWLLIVFPTSFTVLGIFMIWYNFYQLPAHEREANLMLDYENTKTRLFRNLKGVMKGKSKEKNDNLPITMQENAIFVKSPEEPKMCNITNIAMTEGKLLIDPDNFHDFMLHFWENLKKDYGLTLLLGIPQDEACWAKTKDPNSKFIEKYGPLFEEYRGHAVFIKNATLNVDPVTRKVDRGDMIPVTDLPIIKFPVIRFPKTSRVIKIPSVHRFHLQIIAKFLDFIRLILTGCLVAGVGSEEDNIYQVIGLLCITLVIITIFRISKPFHTRFDMGMMWLGESVDVITYSCAIAVLRRSDGELSQNFLRNVGLGMILAQGISLLVQVIENMLLGTEAIFLGKDYFENRKKSKFFEVVHKAMMRDGKYLMRKYGDRWLVKSLYKGLLGRRPLREELPWRVVAGRKKDSILKSLKWFKEELRRIFFLDIRNKQIKRLQWKQLQLSRKKENKI